MMEIALKIKKRINRAHQALEQLQLERGDTFTLTKVEGALSVKSFKGRLTAVFRKQVKRKRIYKSLGVLNYNYSIEHALCDCLEYEKSLKEHGFIDTPFLELQQRVNSIETLDDLACEFFLHHDEIDFPTGAAPLKSLPELQQKYSAYAQKIIGDVYIKVFDKKHIVRVINHIYAQSPKANCKHCSFHGECDQCRDLNDHAALANHLRYILNRIMDLGVQYKLIRTNPIANIKACDIGYKPKRNRRALVMQELKTLICRLEAAMETEPANVCTIYLILLLGVRKEELVTAKFSDFMIDLIPVEDGKGLVEDLQWKLKTTKTGTNRAMFITPLATEFLNKLAAFSNGSDYLLPARKFNSHSPHIHPTTVNKFIDRIAGDLKFVVHELRHTTRTLLSALKIKNEVAESYITHSSWLYMHDPLHLYDERKEAASAISNLITTLREKVKEEALKNEDTI
ncbi:tyrosine-type recombinase/integrase [Pseudoalteromonas pernae]|uniref:tyrosine-type recombinase/integrase n=1 Tax=Pseudoalteromonas pernae TaxID=3118054 RepID=UPI003242F240